VGAGEGECLFVEFNFEGGVFLLIVLVFGEEGFELVDFLLLLGEGVGEAGDDVAVLADAGEVVLVGFQLQQKGSLMA
jgi:hypothetical protein